MKSGFQHLVGRLGEAARRIEVSRAELAAAMGRDRGEPSPRLVCSACGRHADATAEGWRSYLSVDDQLAVYCPDCAADTFDGPG